MRTFNRHQERFIKVTDWGRNVVVNSLQQLNDFLFPNVRAASLESTQGRSHNDRCFVTVEPVGSQEFTHFHFNQFQHFRVLESIDLIDEDDDSLDTDLAGKEQMFTGLWPWGIVSV